MRDSVRCILLYLVDFCKNVMWVAGNPWQHPTHCVPCQTPPPPTPPPAAAPPSPLRGHPEVAASPPKTPPPPPLPLPPHPPLERFVLLKGTYNGNLNYEEVIQPLSNYKEEFNTSSSSSAFSLYPGGNGV
jgi:hypothetical protein